MQQLLLYQLPTMVLVAITTAPGCPDRGCLSCGMSPFSTQRTAAYKLVVCCKMQMQSSLASYNNNRVIGTFIGGFSILHLQTDKQLAKHCSSLCPWVTCSSRLVTASLI